MSLLQHVAIFLLAAVIAVPLFRWLGLGSVLGYLAAGIALGPWGLNLGGDIEQTMSLAEFGVVLLLFVIGLELQPSRLWVMRRLVFGLGPAQVVITTLLLGALAVWLGLTWQAALVVGFALSLSSTPLILQLLAERNQLHAHHGRAAFGILLFQDIAVMPMLALLPLLAPSGTAVGSGPLWLTTLKLVGVLGALVVGSRLILRPLLRLVARTRTTDAFTAAALLIVIATALAVREVGLSMALGAFLAGVLLADSEFRHELEADIEPFKGLLLGLFFIVVGMSANLGLLLAQPWSVVGLTVGFMLIKILALFAISRVSGSSAAVSGRLALALPSGGEFAFVLLTLALRDRIIDAQLADLLVVSVTLSMALSPVLLSLRDLLAGKVAAGTPREFDRIEEREPRILIAGYGRFGQIVSRVLTARHLKFTVLDASEAQVDFVRRFGSKVYYGDASRLELLRAAGADQAEIMVLAIDDVEASIRTAEIVRHNFPHLKIYARARNRQHVFRLMDLGISNVIRETYGSSLEMATRVLEQLGLTKAQALETVTRFRAHDEAALARQHAIHDDEKKLVQSAVESARQLESLFEADAAEADKLRPGA
jgi:glutathione-regulated potassium-efflux system protein KefB